MSFRAQLTFSPPPPPPQYIHTHPTPHPQVHRCLCSLCRNLARVSGYCFVTVRLLGLNVDRKLLRFIRDVKRKVSPHRLYKRQKRPNIHVYSIWRGVRFANESPSVERNRLISLCCCQIFYGCGCSWPFLTRERESTTTKRPCLWSSIYCKVYSWHQSLWWFRSFFFIIFIIDYGYCRPVLA